jgi:hypothetical protein
MVAVVLAANLAEEEAGDRRFVLDPLKSLMLAVVEAEHITLEVLQTTRQQ